MTRTKAILVGEKKSVRGVERSWAGLDRDSINCLGQHLMLDIENAEYHQHDHFSKSTTYNAEI